MTADNGINTIDDVIRLMNFFLSETEKEFSDLKLDKRAAELTMNAETAEECFKSKLVVSYIEQFRRISINISSLNKSAADKAVSQNKAG